MCKWFNQCRVTESLDWRVLPYVEPSNCWFDLLLSIIDLQKGFITNLGCICLAHIELATKPFFPNFFHLSSKESHFVFNLSLS